MPYTPKDWADFPSTTTPITATELERMEAGIDAAVAHAETGGNPHGTTAADVGAAASGHTHSYEASGAVAAHEGAVDPHTGYAQESSLGDAAALDVGAVAGTVAAGDHGHGGVYDSAGTASSAVAAHEGAADPHPGYVLESAVEGVSPETGTWKFDTSTTDSDPGTNKFRLDAATRAAATFLYLDDVSGLGVDVSNLFGQVQSGDTFYIQQSDDPARTVRYVATGAGTDGTGYWKIPVSVDVAAAGSEIGNNKTCLIVARIAAYGGGGSHPHPYDPAGTAVAMAIVLGG